MVVGLVVGFLVFMAVVSLSFPYVALSVGEASRDHRLGLVWISTIYPLLSMSVLVLFPEVFLAHYVQIFIGFLIGLAFLICAGTLGFMADLRE
jgi:hypothetical protein